MAAYSWPRCWVALGPALFNHQWSLTTNGSYRQEGCTDVQSTLVGFAAYKYVAGVGLLPHLSDAFQPVSTAFSVATSSDNGDGFCYSHEVEQCKPVCPEFDTLEATENYVGVSTPATIQMQRSRDKLNLAST